MRARGLKPLIYVFCVRHTKSRPMRARGLKLYWQGPFSAPCLVAPHAGAWIETGHLL